MKPDPSKQGVGERPLPRRPLIVAALGAAAIVLAAWIELRAPLAEPPAGAQAPEGYSAISYKVDAAEWDSEPTLCAISNRFGLGDDEFAATLHLNGGADSCAAPGTRIRFGRQIPLAVSARSGFQTCRKLTESCSSGLAGSRPEGPVAAN